MNLKHKQFCEEYLNNGLNASAAYIKVGYSNNNPDKNAYKLLQRDDIKSYIENKQKQMATKSNIDREYILNEYKELLESCKQEGLDGAGTIKDRSNWAKALSQLTKFLGLDAPEKVDVTSGGAPITFNYVKPKKYDK